MDIKEFNNTAMLIVMGLLLLPVIPGLWACAKEWVSKKIIAVLELIIKMCDKRSIEDQHGC